MFGLIASIAEKTVCASASAFTAGIVIGKKIGQTIKGK
jgi:hypothetical protein